jgi:hypothetical protein
MYHSSNNGNSLLMEHKMSAISEFITQNLPKITAEIPTSANQERY